MIPPVRWGDLVVTGDARHREIVARHGNGIDGVEVREGGRRLVVYFIEHAPKDLGRGNVRIDAPSGSRRVRAVEVRRVVEADRELEDRLIVELDHPGSPGRYRLRLVERSPDGGPGRVPYPGLDARFADAHFVFDVDGPRPTIAAAPAGAPGFDDTVSYLFRDYAGLRQLMLDRLSVTMPQWSEQHEPDIWITLIELLSYLGDDLSYYEDAVATETYLLTARNRISVRRHARLVDYRLSEGCSARAWVCVQVTSPLTLSLADLRFAAAGAYVGEGAPVLDARSFSADQLAQFQQYSPLTVRPGAGDLESAVTLRPAHNAIELWSWGERDSHLVSGATSVVLKDGAPVTGHSTEPARELALAPGDVLILEETADPATLGIGPADPALRQAVRLVEVRPRWDELYRQPLLEVSWAPEDALGFDLAVTAGGRPCGQASGNVVLATHGVPARDTLAISAPALTRSGLSYATPFPDPAVVAYHQARRLRALYGTWRREISDWLTEAMLGHALSTDQLEVLRLQVGASELEALGLASADRARDAGDRAARDALGLAELLVRADLLLAERRRRLEALARLAETSGPLEDVLIAELGEDWGEALTAPLAAGRPGCWGPAATAVVQDPTAALPVLALTDTGGDAWSPALDLIGVTPAQRAFVAEINDLGLAQLRVNNPPVSGTLNAAYWLGNGTAGNAEVEAINALVWAPGATGVKSTPAAVSLVRNPLAVTSGIDAETTAAAKLAIPGSFHADQPRALTAADYAKLAGDVTGVRRAAAETRFTGSQTVIEVAIQPEIAEDPADALLDEVRRALGLARRVGHLVRVVPPRYQPLVLTLEVALTPTTIRAQVGHHLARLLSSGWLADGTAALFHPAGLAFATPLYSSPIIAAVHAIAGVQSVTLTRFGFLDRAAAGGAVPTELDLGTLEIARLDNDPVKPEHGYATVYLEGGR